ncbi:efflux RND transporter periplasmic adaptor subunit [Aquabacterium soli]|jgi:membrane fusion protein, multidrug efflux system|uniref:Efflux RND transporter periplasmic adaptor subunit n=1 Tax=Aquabacterium soli TaxID=2493092 RepID=A0A426VEH1_9BURK|nr:efflux RND transporter periplasmic adaptor subunit [Aquabacterium soli]RRS05296.1 efflux RND transporter periplasmic adaptor subunit [Aquabacterium soli]
MVSRRWVWTGLAVSAGLMAWLSTALSPKLQAADPPKASPAVPVRVIQASLQDLPSTLSAVGQVQALQQVLVRPQIEGVLTEVLFKEGQPVTRGQVLARLDDRSLRAQVDQAQADVNRLKAQLQIAQLDLKRYEGLAAQAAVSTQQLDQQVALVAELRAQVQSQEAAANAARVQLSYATITSPVAGRAGLRQVDVGNLVRPTDANGLVSVVQTQPVAVIFSVPQGRLGEVRQAVKQSAPARVQIADQEQGTLLAEGRLTTVDNRVDPASGSLKLKAEVPNVKEELWPGQFVAVTLRTGTLDQALVVPTQALQRGLKDATFVWRVRDNVAEMVPVKVRWQDDQRAVIASGIAAGDAVVVDGQSRLKPKATVKVLPAAAAKG